MFKKTIAITVAVIIIVQTLLNLGLYAYYTMNKKMIAEKLCVNKSKPQMHCNGHCFLSKQLKKAEQNEKQQSQVLKEKDEIVNKHDKDCIVLYTPSYQVTIIYPKQSVASSYQYHLDIIKPPADSIEPCV